MRQTVKGIKKRLDALDKSDGETFEIYVERTVSDNLQGIGIVTSLKRIVISPDGVTSETLIDDKQTKGDKDNAR